MPDPTAEIEHATGGQQRCAQPVGGDVALEGRVKATGGGRHPLAGDQGDRGGELKSRLASTYTVPPAPATISTADSAAATGARATAAASTGPPARAGDLAAARTRAPDRAVEIRAARERPDQTVEPAEHDLAPAPVTAALHRKAARANALAQRLTPAGGRGGAADRDGTSARRRCALASCRGSGRRSRGHRPGRAVAPRDRARPLGRADARANARTRPPPTRPDDPRSP